jgi:hypothetical protein
MPADGPRHWAIPVAGTWLCGLDSKPWPCAGYAEGLKRDVDELRARSGAAGIEKNQLVRAIVAAYSEMKGGRVRFPSDAQVRVEAAVIAAEYERLSRGAD